MVQKSPKSTNDLLRELVDKKSLWYRFLSGIATGLGATVGVALVLTLVGYLLSKIQLIPVIGGWLSEIANEALNNINTQPLLK